MRNVLSFTNDSITFALRLADERLEEWRSAFISCKLKIIETSSGNNSSSSSGKSNANKPLSMTTSNNNINASTSPTASSSTPSMVLFNKNDKLLMEIETLSFKEWSNQHLVRWLGCLFIQSFDTPISMLPEAQNLHLLTFTGEFLVNYIEQNTVHEVLAAQVKDFEIVKVITEELYKIKKQDWCK